MVRKKHNKRASKYSLDQQGDLTHFGKRIADMPKSELRQAYVGSGDERDEEPFSYDSLIAKSKEFRAASRRQKMEAEAELEELDDSFKDVWTSLPRRDLGQDKMNNMIVDGEDDLAFIARSFQMENIRKAVATERRVTEAEVEEAKKVSARKLEDSRRAALRDNEYAEEEVVVESDDDLGEPLETVIPVLPTPSSPSSLIPLIESLLFTNPTPPPLENHREQLVEFARKCDPEEMREFFINHLQTPNNDEHILSLLRIVSFLFPLDHVRHPIAVPALKVLERICAKPEAGRGHLELLCEFLTPAGKYSSVFLLLGGRLYREENISTESSTAILSIVSGFCSKFSRESLEGPILHFFPELLPLLPLTPFVPLRLHQFKPIEVLSLEPAFHEDGSQWNGEHKELRAAKKLAQEFKKDKRLTAKEMRREAGAQESFFAMERKKEQAKIAAKAKRSLAALDQAENNFRQMRTDNGQEPTKQMKDRKKRRLGGNKQ